MHRHETPASQLISASNLVRNLHNEFVTNAESPFDEKFHDGAADEMALLFEKMCRPDSQLKPWVLNSVSMAILLRRFCSFDDAVCSAIARSDVSLSDMVKFAEDSKAKKLDAVVSKASKLYVGKKAVYEMYDWGIRMLVSYGLPISLPGSVSTALAAPLRPPPHASATKVSEEPSETSQRTSHSKNKREREPPSDMERESKGERSDEDDEDRSADENDATSRKKKHKRSSSSSKKRRESEGKKKNKRRDDKEASADEGRSEKKKKRTKGRASDDSDDEVGEEEANLQQKGNGKASGKKKKASDPRATEQAIEELRNKKKKSIHDAKDELDAPEIDYERAENDRELIGRKWKELGLPFVKNGNAISGAALEWHEESNDPKAVKSKQYRDKGAPMCQHWVQAREGEESAPFSKRCLEVGSETNNLDQTSKTCGNWITHFCNAHRRHAKRDFSVQCRNNILNMCSHCHAPCVPDMLPIDKLSVYSQPDLECAEPIALCASCASLPHVKRQLSDTKRSLDAEETAKNRLRLESLHRMLRREKAASRNTGGGATASSKPKSTEADDRAEDEEASAEKREKSPEESFLERETELIEAKRAERANHSAPSVHEIKAKKKLDGETEERRSSKARADENESAMTVESLEEELFSTNEDAYKKKPNSIEVDPILSELFDENAGPEKKSKNHVRSAHQTNGTPKRDSKSDSASERPSPQKPEPSVSDNKSEPIVTGMKIDLADKRRMIRLEGSEADEWLPLKQGRSPSTVAFSTFISKYLQRVRGTDFAGTPVDDPASSITILDISLGPDPSRGGELCLPRVSARIQYEKDTEPEPIDDGHVSQLPRDARHVLMSHIDCLSKAFGTSSPSAPASTLNAFADTDSEKEFS